MAIHRASTTPQHIPAKTSTFKSIFSGMFEIRTPGVWCGARKSDLSRATCLHIFYRVIFKRIGQRRDTAICLPSANTKKSHARRRGALGTAWHGMARDGSYDSGISGLRTGFSFHPFHPAHIEAGASDLLDFYIVTLRPSIWVAHTKHKTPFSTRNIADADTQDCHFCSGYHLREIGGETSHGAMGTHS